MRVHVHLQRMHRHRHRHRHGHRHRHRCTHTPRSTLGSDSKSGFAASAAAAEEDLLTVHNEWQKVGKHNALSGDTTMEHRGDGVTVGRNLGNSNKEFGFVQYSRAVGLPHRKGGKK